LIKDEENLKEITRNQHYVIRTPLNKILKYKDKSKDKAMYEAHLQYGYTLKE
jgi:outer membrane protease